MPLRQGLRVCVWFRQPQVPGAGRGQPRAGSSLPPGTSSGAVPVLASWRSICCWGGPESTIELRDVCQMVVVYLPLRAVCEVPAGKAGVVMGRVTAQCRGESAQLLRAVWQPACWDRAHLMKHFSGSASSTTHRCMEHFQSRVRHWREG